MSTGLDALDVLAGCSTSLSACTYSRDTTLAPPASSLALGDQRREGGLRAVRRQQQRSVFDISVRLLFGDDVLMC